MIKKSKSYEQKKSITLIVIVLFITVLASKAVYDIIDHEIFIRELNLHLAEDANRTKLSLSSYLYDCGRKGYGAYQDDRYDYEEHLHIYEKRKEKIESLKTIRNLSSASICIIGIGISFIIYKRNARHNKIC